MPRLPVLQNFEFLNNSSIRLGTLIADELEKSDNVMIAVAYATIPSSHEVMKRLRNLVLKKNKHVQIIVGLGYANTSPDCLKALLALQEESKKKLCCKVRNEERFHPKLYIFDKVNGQETIVTGSSNLTSEGLQENIEANVVIRENVNDQFAVKCKMFFKENLWKSVESKKLTSAIIDDYQLNYNDKQFAVKRASKQHAKRLRKSLGESFSEELSLWKGFDEEFMGYLESLCGEAEQLTKSGCSYYGFQNLGKHVQMVGSFEALVKEMSRNGFLYFERKKGRYPEEETVEEIESGTSAYFQRCFRREEWKDFFRLFVFLIFGQEAHRTGYTGLLVVCLDLIGKNRLTMLRDSLSDSELLEDTIEKCQNCGVKDFVLYSSQKYCPERNIDQLASLQTLIRGNSIWNRLSLESFLTEDLLLDREKFLDSKLLNKIVTQSNRLSRLCDFLASI